MHLDTIYIINGPNLNLLGRREVEIYGHISFDEYISQLRKRFSELKIHYFQSNHEGRLIDKLQEVGFLPSSGIVLNAAGYTHTSVSIRDAVASIEAPVVEVHISDIESREEFRRFSFIRDKAVHFIKGQGLDGYAQAVEFLLQLQ